MKRSTVLCCALALLPSYSVFADLVVTPELATANGNAIGVFPGRDPQTASGADEKRSPSSFGHGGDFSRSDGQNNRLSSGFLYDDEFFFQRSPIGPVDRISLKGYARSLAESLALTSPIQSTATSFGEMSFEVTEPVAFHLTGYISIDQITKGGPGFANSIVGARLHQFAGGSGALNIDKSLAQTQTGSIVLDQTGILNPGRYFFEAYASVLAVTGGPNSSYRAEVSYDAKVEFTAIPAPSSLALLALAALAPRRRRA